MKYGCDAPFWGSGEFQASADVIRKRTNALGARHRSVTPPQKIICLHTCVMSGNLHHEVPIKQFVIFESFN